MYDQVEHTEDMHVPHGVPIQYPCAARMDDMLQAGLLVPQVNFGFVPTYVNFLVDPVATMNNGVQRAALQVFVVPPRIDDAFLIRNLGRIMTMAD